MTRYFYKSMLLFICFSPLFISGQNNTITLTLQQAIDLGVKQNLMRKVSQMEIEKKKEKINEYMGNLFPNIKASGTYSKNIESPVIFMPAGPPFYGSILKIGAENSYVGALSFGLPLFNMSIYNAIALGKKDLELSKEKLRENELELVSNIKKTYYNLLLINESYSVMNKSYLHAKENVDNIQKMNKQGLVSDYDFLRAQVQVENIRPNLIQLKNSYNNVMGLFKVLLNIDDSIHVTIDTTLIYDENIFSNINKDSLMAMENNTTLKQLEIQKQLLKAQYNLTKGAMFPTLTAIGNYQYQSQSEDYKFNDYKWVKSSLVGLQLNVPIFAGLTIRRQMKQVRITSDELSLQQEFTRRTLQTQINTSISNMQVAQEKLNWALQNMNMAEKAYSIAKTRYNTGQSTLLELNDADNALTQAMLNHIQAKFEYLNASFDLEKLLGNSLK